MTSFKDLHRPGDPLLLPNAWDVVTGAALAAAGFEADRHDESRRRRGGGQARRGG